MLTTWQEVKKQVADILYHTEYSVSVPGVGVGVGAERRIIIQRKDIKHPDYITMIVMRLFNGTLQLFPCFDATHDAVLLAPEILSKLLVLAEATDFLD